MKVGRSTMQVTTNDLPLLYKGLDFGSEGEDGRGSKASGKDIRLGLIRKDTMQKADITIIPPSTIQI